MEKKEQRRNLPPLPSRRLSPTISPQSGRDRGMSSMRPSLRALPISLPSSLFASEEIKGRTFITVQKEHMCWPPASMIDETST